MSELLANTSSLYIIAAIAIALLLVKKLIKWAFIIGVICVIAYLDSTGSFDALKSQLGLN
ncbi:MAG: hypothetical protein F2839_00120 [Actinobacteria bacterium]|uniref:Unannotated protein n=1 Tax=freshwater metagenome TaxID=449393 RepID=A0A6J5YN21_9ZZZZ|nr:hypothetical protein [Actinomycetota bacterium]